ncbi:hypothetical protein [Asticcacaulis endophyticus]|uniref:Uncharacterized protein n=1 Tax=Asticcacaulis endophyticus TaxID=1395890 RepID=A0A918URJ2_9CAUL|nr:hypothetical protein [Asticcacaulis endophyticus]GGZ29114.1 hypothetical protein GCM10011273_13850 [Asticcacaulis endophyticus]
MRRTRLNVVPPVSKPHGKENGSNGHATNGHMNGHSNVIEAGFNGDGGPHNGTLATIALDMTSINLPEVSVTASMAEAYLAKGESRNERVRKLQEEAKRLAREQILEFEVLLEATAKMALDIADGGDIYSVGSRELCRRLADELPRTLQTLQAITKRN